MEVLRGEDPDRIGDFRLLGRLGEGGMGVVYLARTPRGRMVAVKTIRPELASAPDFRRRFAREIAAAQRVGGQWTATVLAAAPDAEPPWVATAYVAGPTLHQVVAEHGPLPERSVRALTSGLSHALSDIHAAGLVHRDLKPSNVMVTVGGPRVIDFGVVRALDASAAGGLTATGAVIGSLGFMSPEQIRGERLTEASDVFSLGTVLAFAASGRTPFDVPGNQPHAVMYRVVHEPPDLADVPTPLRELVRACLAKDPAARPTPAELLEAEEAEGRPPGPWLPPDVLARLGEEAVRLLDAEDPLTRATEPAVPAPPTRVDAGASLAEAPTESAPSPSGSRTALVTAPVTASATAPADDDIAGPPPSLAQDRRRLSRERVGGPVGLHWLLGLLAVLSVVAAALQLVSRQAHESGYYGLSEWDRGDYALPLVLLVSDIVYAVQILVTALLTAYWVVWFRRLRARAETLAPGRLRYSPSAAVWAWFVPGVNLVVPHQIANDIWHAASPEARPRGFAAAGALHAWWAGFTAALLALGFRLIPPRTPWALDYRSELDFPAANAVLAAHLVTAAAVIPAIILVRRLSATGFDNRAAAV
ncbi:protein kinase domain-containing protein [Streptomyces hainanensis]|uniref:DUF4328 domain-containing protein n=1 Tax=Streptomyces hainanensis TaxID=402648 RepID=A0A4R4TIF5_9ACTN|nr:protein kinase [Streptomyces hainanensis]TDC76166.1 DUF4328 domain-containing protein [Streptomyces hainanensis]